MDMSMRQRTIIVVFIHNLLHAPEYLGETIFRAFWTHAWRTRRAHTSRFPTRTYSNARHCLLFKWLQIHERMPPKVVSWTSLNSLRKYCATYIKYSDRCTVVACLIVMMIFCFLIGDDWFMYGFWANYVIGCGPSWTVMDEIMLPITSRNARLKKTHNFILFFLVQLKYSSDKFVSYQSIVGGLIIIVRGDSGVKGGSHHHQCYR